MTFVLTLLGAMLGPFICAGMFEERTGWTAAVLGAFIGSLLGQLRRVRKRLAELERRLAAAQTEQIAAMPHIAVAAPPAPVAAPPATPVAAPVPPPPPAPPVPRPAAAEIRIPEVAIPTAPAPRPVRQPSQPDPLTLFVERVKRWFTEGNVPVKVGILVLFLGVAALLKYLADEGVLNVPIELRLAGIAASAVAALAFAWRKRASHRAFALSLQGGAIGVLLLTIFAAFRLYALLPAGAAFALLVIVVAGAGMLAVLQDALALAVLAIVGGFVAPILISTGSGNHVALFAYYAVLNAAIFAIAWVRPWRALNLLGFAFTFGIGTLWGALRYQPAFFASTEPFLFLFFAFYLLIPVLYARRLAADRRDLIDGTLVFGTPLVVFALQASLLYPDRMPLAYSALGAAAIYTALAWLELRRLGLRLLGESHALLALGFATIAVPLALSARTTASTWALEGAALVWLGLRQNRRLPRWIGYALQGAAGFAYLAGYTGSPAEHAVLNGQFLGALLVGLAGLASARALSLRNARAPLAALFFVWAWLWWWFAAGNDIARFAAANVQADWWLVLIAATGVAAAEGFRRLAWIECAWPALAQFALAPFLIGATTIGNDGPLESWGAAAWAFWFVASLRALANLVAGAQRLVPMVHFVFLWTVALVLAVELGHFADDHLEVGDVWVGLGLLAPLAALMWFALARSAFVRWPDAAVAERGRNALLISLAAVLGCAWIAGLFVEGAPAPVSYVPLFNPLETSQLGFLLLLLAWYRRADEDGQIFIDAELRARALAVAGAVLLTAITLRGAHFLGGVPWSEALWDSPLAQAALSIVWTVAGIAAMLLGKRRGSRAVWIGGGALMGVVILKLVVIDRHHLNNLAAIVGVLIVGVLLVGVGYFAPAPPRTRGAGL